MSAYLDKSQGITFVYTNIHKVYRQAKEAKIDAPFAAESARVFKKDSVKVTEFQPEKLETKNHERTFAVPMGVREAEEKARSASQRSIANLQKNLSDLTDAQERLRFLLQEIESLTKKK